MALDTSKIIHAPVGGGRYTVASPIVKEDYGLYLKIEGLELPSTYEVDFSNSEHNGTSVTMIGNSDGVLIPSQFISSGKDVFAFLYHVGADYGRTVYKFRIPNKLRPDRTDEEPTPEEQSIIDQAISALNEAVEQTAGDVESADQSAQSAQGYAEQAESARDTAQTYANNAQTSAISAQTSASQASASASASAQSASQSAQIKVDVENLVDDTQGYAQASAQSASASANSATSAQGYAQSASVSAQSASGYASSAQSSANTASTKAQDASTSAQTASQKATEASQSASQALTYKTDAETAKTASQTAQGKAEDAQTAAETAQGLAEDARDEAQSLVDGISGKVEQIDSNTERIESLEDDRYKPYVVDSASGSIASFPDGADDIPLKSLIVDINPVQDLSNGDPSPENICPISGWTEVDVEQRGKNLYNPVTALLNTWITLDTGEIVNGANGFWTSDFIPVKPSVAYTKPNTGSSRGAWYDANKNWISATNWTSGTITAPTNARYVRFCGQTSTIAYNGQVQFEEGSTATPYSPYTGRSINISLGQTVYGGKLDVLSGELVIDRAKYIFGQSDVVNGLASGTNGLRLRIDINDSRIPTSTQRLDFMCNAGIPSNRVLTSAVWEVGDCMLYDYGEVATLFYIVPLDCNTAQKAIDYITGLGLEIVYPLATPIEIQLSANQLNSLYGVNNIWADSGDTSAEYRADTKLFIERLTAPDSADMIADSNITSGQYFMVGNSLYKATANIASGSAVIVGTNCTRKSLSEALNEINS